MGTLCFASWNLRSFKEQNCGDTATEVGGASRHSHLVAAGLSEGSLTCCAHGEVLGGGGDRLNKTLLRDGTAAVGLLVAFLP